MSRASYWPSQPLLASKHMSWRTAVRVVSVPVGKTPVQFGDWLRRELTSRDYDPQRGGQSKFAREAGIDVSIINRVLRTERVPEVDALRRIGAALGYSLGEMLVFANLATSEELPVRGAQQQGAALAGAQGSTVYVLDDLRAKAKAQDASLGEILIQQGLARTEDLRIPALDPVEADLLSDDSLDPVERERWLRLHRNLKREIAEMLAEARKRRSEQ